MEIQEELRHRVLREAEKPQGAASNIGDIIAGGDVLLSTGNQTVTQSGGGINLGQARDVTLGQSLPSQEKNS
jgi:hypothetical protein